MLRILNGIFFTCLFALVAPLAFADDVRDWDAIVKSREIRVVMGTTAASYSNQNGVEQGFDYDLAKMFADKHGLFLRVIPAPDNFELINYVIEGKADIAAGFLTPTPERIAMGLAFSEPYHFARQVLVTRTNDTINNFQDLKGRSIVVRPSSSYWSTVQQLRFFGLKTNLVAADESLNTSSIIDRVAKGHYDTTIADSHILAMELAKRSDVKPSIDMSEPSPHAWAANSESPEVLKQANEFIKSTYNSAEYKKIHEKYFAKP